jgi:hypothetical protein
VFDAVGGYEFVGATIGDDMDGYIEWEDVHAELYDIDQGLLEETLLSKGL